MDGSEGPPRLGAKVGYPKVFDFRRYASPVQVKTIEYRSRRTRIIGERFYIYASKKRALDNGHWAIGEEVDTPTPALPHALRSGGGSRHFPTGALNGEDALTPALTHALRSGGGSHKLLTGVIVGSARIVECVRNGRGYESHLADVKRLKQPRKPKRQPQPVWFNPF